MKLVKTGLGFLSLTLLSASALAYDLAQDVKVNLELRPRYEHVNVDNSPNDNANALTVRIRVGTTFKNLFNVEGLDLLFEPWVVTA
ncbi:MAG: hypothetical protein GXO03_03450, partial [Aquificae bacterium]|nr:hypothetical protein [Aquificota bacterium]